MEVIYYYICQSGLGTDQNGGHEGKYNSGDVSVCQRCVPGAASGHPPAIRHEEDQ